MIKFFLMNPIGFCFGVDKAIKMANSALVKYGSPIYVFNYLVHNNYVTKNLENKGLIFVKDISRIPNYSVVMISAHGISKKTLKLIKKKHLVDLLNTTCPLVRTVHTKILKASSKNAEVILIGKSGHPEIEGTLGHYDNNSSGIYLIESVEDVDYLKVKNADNLFCITQTTLSVLKVEKIISCLVKKFPKIKFSKNGNICHVVAQRQFYTRKLLKIVDLMIVIGSRYSSNACCLLDISLESGKPSYLIDSVLEIDQSWFHNISYVGVVSGTSVPYVIVQEIVKFLKKIGEVFIYE
ncbi:hypothetical protein AOQ88_02370 [Candidatus Riesia sp. GBBU]|nr:hypothetical protein AOQ88_02080 [Candidatus Riesia sp. GBBU]ARC55065.1 hypothetical protein AOQ88_02370 [Candidatus Riesia sp. GBBU]